MQIFSLLTCFEYRVLDEDGVWLSRCRVSNISSVPQPGNAFGAISNSIFVSVTEDGVISLPLLGIIASLAVSQ